jgi:hypothetical protein
MYDKELKEDINNLMEKLLEIYGLNQSLNKFMSFTFSKIEDIDININSLDDNVTELKKDKYRIERVQLANETLNKYENYINNIDRLNVMVNELKGCVGIIRANKEDNCCKITMKTICNYIETIDLRLERIDSILLTICNYIDTIDLRLEREVRE